MIVLVIILVVLLSRRAPAPHGMALTEGEVLACLPADWQSPAAIVLVLDATMIGKPFPNKTWHSNAGRNDLAIRTPLREHGTNDGSRLRRAIRRIARVVVGPAHSRAMAGPAQRGGGCAVAAPLVSVPVYCHHGKH